MSSSSNPQVDRTTPASPDSETSKASTASPTSPDSETSTNPTSPGSEAPPSLDSKTSTGPKTPIEIIQSSLNLQLIEKRIVAASWLRLLENSENEDQSIPVMLYGWAKYREAVKESGDVVEFDFSKSSLTVICEHAVLLHIEIESVRNIREGIAIPVEEGTGKVVSYHVPITFSPIPLIDEKRGDRNKGLCLLLCDFDNATMISTLGIAHDDTTGTKVNLASYLMDLQTGGYNTFFSPLMFLEHTNVHSPPDTPTLKSIPDKIFGFTAEMINGYLSDLWRLCELIATLEWDRDNSELWSLADCTSHQFPCSKREGERHVSMKFGKPTVTLLCECAVMLHFILTDVKLDGDDEMEPVYQGQSISFIANISGSGAGIRIKPESVRHVEFSGVRKLNLAERELERLRHFFVEYYFKPMARRLKFLFRTNRVIQPHPLPHPLPGIQPVADVQPVLKGDIRYTTMEGFDVVIALSQTSINEQILQIFKMHRSEMHQVQQHGDCSINIKEVTVDWLDATEALGTTKIQAEESSQNENPHTDSATVISGAIITIHVTKATVLVPEKPSILGTDKSTNSEQKPNSGVVSFECQECQLTFEVDIKVENSDSNSSLKNIYLDLKNALIVPQCSLRADEYDLEKFCAYMALSDRIKHHYFPRLLNRGMNILARVPVYKPAAKGSFHRLTTMLCRTFAAETTTTRSEQILFILGMVGGRAPPSVCSFKPSAAWLGGGHGTLAISGLVLRDALLPLLERVHALTTFIHFVRKNSDGTTAAVDILPWEKHPDYQGTACKWDPKPNCPNKFSWNRTHEWCVRNEGTPGLPPVKGEDRIVCETNNTLELPYMPESASDPNSPLKIVMSGGIILRVSSRAEGSHDQVTRSSLDWKIIIAVKMSTWSGGGVEVDIKELVCTPGLSPDPTEEFNKPRIDKFPDIHATLNSQLLQTKDLETVLEEMRKLEGDCEYYYPSSSKAALSAPTSNWNGDFLFELRHSPVFRDPDTPASAV